VIGEEETKITSNSVNTILEQILLKYTKEGGHWRDQKHVNFFLGIENRNLERPRRR
jgi:hypothetical protein